MRNRLMLSALFCAALGSAAQAAQPDDAWLAWIGCWRAEGDTSGRSLCIVPDGDGVRMLTLMGRNIESESRVVATGQPQTISQEGCAGTETARWSVDRQRVFLNAGLNCGNDVTRKVTGMFVMLNPAEWVSVQSIATGGNSRLHSVRYLAASPDELPESIAQTFEGNRLARETVRIAATARLSLDDVTEAVSHVEANVVESWLTTVGQPFNLNAQKLIALADAGVPGTVIDVLVAVSYPGHFAVREELATERDGRRRRRPVHCYDAFDGYVYDPFAYRGAGLYGYDYGCRGSGLYGWGGGYYGGGRVIVIDRGRTRSTGRVTKEGYKSGRPRDNSSPSTGTVSSTPSAKAPAASSSGSSGSDSSGSDGGGRKAKPRDN